MSAKTRPAPTDLPAVLNRLEDYALPVEQYLDRSFGPGTWKRDPYTAQYIVVDHSHTGPGRGFFIVEESTQTSALVISDFEIN